MDVFDAYHTYIYLRSESDDTNAANGSNISGNSSGIFSISSSTQDDESSNSSPECADISLSNNDASLTDMSSITTPDVPGIDYIQRAKDLISDDGWQ